jgi:hypothetical protein
MAQRLFHNQEKVGGTYKKALLKKGSRITEEYPAPPPPICPPPLLRKKIRQHLQKK